MSKLVVSDLADKDRIIVIGGGPAGLMAAGSAAAAGVRVTLFEKNASCGRKLLITGAGRCNVTNSALFDQFLEHFPENRRFLNPAFRQFFVDDLINFFERYGLRLVREENGKYFPETQQAGSVLDVLLQFCKDGNVIMRTHEAVNELSWCEDHWLIKTDRAEYSAKAVIMATGGLSYPRTGSDGSGLRMAASLRHSLVPTRPSLVPLNIAQPACAPLSGVSVSDVPVTLWQQAPDQAWHKIASQRGDLLFTHFGVSGPAVLFLSRSLPSGFDQSHAGNFELSVDLVPALLQTELESKLLQALAESPKKHLKSMISKAFDLPRAVAELVITAAGLSDEELCQHVTREIRKTLISSLKDFRLKITGTRGYREAMVTAGGVSTTEINPKTMQSRLWPGLYFAGEIIDIDGLTGGFNLQAAFSTGYLAGKEAAREI